jgi:hypothetical protein
VWPSSTRRSPVGSSPDTGQRTAIAEDPTLTERQGQAFLASHAAFRAENSAQHSLATDKNTEED